MSTAPDVVIGFDTCATLHKITVAQDVPQESESC
jgi:hypothetical protein